MKMIITRPQHDITTKYLALWAKEIIEFAHRKKIDVIDLNKQKANKFDFVGRVKKIKPDVIFLNGHGNNNCVAGHDNKDLVKAGDNHDILANTITYALSCNSAKILGPKVVKNKNTTYIGYKDEFVFVCDKNYLTKPLSDPQAKPFKESSNQLMISLLKGNSAQKASEKSKDKFREYYFKLSSSDADADDLQAAQCLWWNRRNQVCLGDAGAELKL